MSTIASATAPKGVFRPLRVLLRLIGGLLAAVLLLILGASAYEAVLSAGDATRYPAAGKLVDVGGHRLHLNCTGSGGPTVILDAGLGGSSLDWSLVQPELSRTTTVCAYDRAGMGWSEPGPSPRMPKQISEELKALLAEAKIPGPYVLVGHSLAGKALRLFASAHPDLVSGMVLVDARSEFVDARLTAAEVAEFASNLRAQSQQYWVAGRLGLARLLGAGLIGQPSLPQDVATEMAVLQTLPAAIAATEAEGIERSANDAELAGASLGDVPLVVIASRDSLDHTPYWPEAQQHLVDLSTNSSFVIADGTHAVPVEHPEVVIEAVREVMRKAARTAP